MLKDSYLTVKEAVTSEIKIKRSKFISHAIPVKNQLSIPKILKEIRKKYFDAAHQPYAFRIGIKAGNFRVNDDGEPSGSSGKPILEAIDKYKLSDILIIVVRYFGGIKLGTGGLRRAYFLSAEAALEKSRIVEVILCNKYHLDFDYKYLKHFMNYFDKKKIKIIENISGEKAGLKIEVRESLDSTFRNDIVEISKNNIQIKNIK